MEYASAALSWIGHHPEATIQTVLLVWAIANVVWAQWPKPHTPKAQKMWRLVHTFFGLVATHSTAKGTFTWPSFVRAVIAAATKRPSPSPFDDDSPAPHTGEKKEP